MKIYYGSIYKQCKTTLGLRYLLKPSFKRRWNNKIIYIGTRGFYIVIDIRKNWLKDMFGKTK